MIRNRVRALVAVALSLVLVASGSVAASADPEEPPLDPTIELAFDLVATPTIAGTAKVGAALTANPGIWSPAPAFLYQWSVGGAEVAGAEFATFVPDSTALGSTVTVTVTAILEGYEVTSRTSVPTKTVALGTQTLSTPTISGSPRVGRTLTAVVATTTPGATFSYRWYANGSPISGATGETLTISASHRGRFITVRVTSTLDGYTTIAKTSARSSKVGYGTLSKATPTLSGTAEITHTVCADPGAWTSGTRLSYQWYLNGAKISGATKSCIRISSKSWKGKRLTVVVTGTKSGYTTTSARSSASSPIYVPGQTTPVSAWNCPTWAPIKGNASSMIYHMPGQRFYTRTKPEACFSTESAARAAGYRKAKV